MPTKIRLNLSRSDLYACGRVAVWSSMLDTVMEVLIWHLLELPLKNARCLTHGANADRKLTWLKILADKPSLTATERHALVLLLNDVKSALEWRNRVVHGLWHIGDDGRPWVIKFTEKGGTSWHGKLTDEDIHPIAGNVKTLANGLADWLDARDPNALASAFPSTAERKAERPHSRSRQNPRRASPKRRAAPRRPRITSRG